VTSYPWLVVREKERLTANGEKVNGLKGTKAEGITDINYTLIWEDYKARGLGQTFHQTPLHSCADYTTGSPGVSLKGLLSNSSM
jgi:hypothetical protein